jgi:hypothetical protein
MIKKTTLSLVKFILFSIFLFTNTNLHCQTIIPQQLDGLEKLCAGSFNEFYATFSYVDFPNSTTFQIEFSDKSGSFSQGTRIAIELEVTNLSVTQQTIKFAVPVDLVGSDTYSLRVKSSTGAVSSRFRNSLNSTSFAIFYKDYESAFFINNKNSNAVICSGGSMTLSVFNETPNVLNSSPANYPNIKYRWYKDDVIIAGQSNASLLVNSEGQYYAQIDYGLCSEFNISSNRVSIVSSSSGSAVTIDSNLGNPFCYNGTGTVLSATGGGNNYVWKKDGTIITGVNTRTYSASESGIYTVEVDFGGCKATGSINLSINSFNASIDVADETEIQEGETISVTVTDDASNPTYEWYLNGNIVSGATTDTYLVAVRGNYKVKISQAGGCISSKEFSFLVKGDSGPSTVIPNIIKLSGSSNPYWNIPNEYKNANTQVMIISSNGDKVLDVVNYQGDWPQTSIEIKNINPVYYYVIKGDAGEKKGSITVLK